jgi:hypothetical protein
MPTSNNNFNILNLVHGRNLKESMKKQQRSKCIARSMLTILFSITTYNSRTKILQCLSFLDFYEGYQVISTTKSKDKKTQSDIKILRSDYKCQGFLKWT